MSQDWQGVDEGWGRQAVDFATLSEPANCREYVSLHQHLGVGAGDRLLDIACGSGLAVELAAARGADCAGIDASPRLVAVARDRSPDADLRVGDMHALPWDDDSFDVVTSFRGIWGTTPDALAEVHRVLRPGGRVGITVWGHIKASPGAWALAPFTPGRRAEGRATRPRWWRSAGPAPARSCWPGFGFTGVERVEVPFAWEFADPETYARALAATGPAYEAIQAVGEEAFRAYADRDRRRAGARRAAAARARSPWSATSPAAAPRDSPATSGQLPRRGGADRARPATLYDERHRRPGLRHERVAALGAPAGRARRAVRPDGRHGHRRRAVVPRPRRAGVGVRVRDG